MSRRVALLLSLCAATAAAQPLGTEEPARDQPWKRMVDVTRADYDMALVYVRPGYIAAGHWETCPTVFADTAEATFCEKMLLPDLTQRLDLPRAACVILWILKSHTVCIPGRSGTPDRPSR